MPAPITIYRVEHAYISNARQLAAWQLRLPLDAMGLHGTIQDYRGLYGIMQDYIHEGLCRKIEHWRGSSGPLQDSIHIKELFK